MCMKYIHGNQFPSSLNIICMLSNSWYMYLPSIIIIIPPVFIAVSLFSRKNASHQSDGFIQYTFHWLLLPETIRATN